MHFCWRWSWQCGHLVFCYFYLCVIVPNSRLLSRSQSFSNNKQICNQIVGVFFWSAWTIFAPASHTQSKHVCPCSQLTRCRYEDGTSAGRHGVPTGLSGHIELVRRIFWFWLFEQIGRERLNTLFGWVCRSHRSRPHRNGWLLDCPLLPALCAAL